MNVEVQSPVNQCKTTEESKRMLTPEETDQLLEVRRRVKALKKLQIQKLKLDGELEKEVLKVIKSKFQKQYDTIFERRAQIIRGSVEPTEEDCDFDLDSENSGPIIPVKDPKVEGIPGFWLKSLQNFNLIREWIFELDEPLLYHLTDIAHNYSENPTKLTLEFRFEANEYFTNDVLTKEYELAFGPDPKSLWELNPCHPLKRKGSQIKWKKGKNLTKSKSSKSLKSIDDITSFFCFFDIPEQPKDKSRSNEDLDELLDEDWQLGITIARSVVPNAVLCYSGDLVESESESDSSSESSEEESDSASEESDSVSEES